MTKIEMVDVAPKYIPSALEVKEDFGGDLRLTDADVTSILINSVSFLTWRQKAVLEAVSEQSEDGVAVSYGDMERKLFGDDE